MGVLITRYESTPNPNALKCVLSAPVSDRPRSYLKAEDAQGDHPVDVLARTLFEHDGLRCLLFNTDWFTINKTESSEWPAIKKAAESALASFGGPDR